MMPQTPSPAKPVTPIDRLSRSVGLSLVVLVLASGCNRPPASLPAADGHSAVGTEVPDLRLVPREAADVTVTLADLPAEVVLLNFWGTWCPPCRQELPHLAAIQQEYRDDSRFQLVAVSCGGPGQGDAQVRSETEQFLASGYQDFPVYFDPRLERLPVLQAVESSGYPTTILLDGNRRVLAVWEGFPMFDNKLQERTTNEMRRLIQQALDAPG